MLSLKQLKAFCTIVEAGTFKAAADRLNMTQPPLSRQIRQLETELGVQLFDRTERKALLTGTGAFFYQRALGLLEQADRVLDQTQSYARGLEGELRIGITDDFVYSAAYQRVLEYMSAYPEVEVRTELGTSSLLMRMLEDSQLDVVLTNLPLSIQREHFQVSATEPTRLMVVVPVDHPFSKKKKLPPKALHQARVILLPDTSTAPFAEQYRRLFKSEGVKPARAPQTDNSELQLQMVRQGIGIGLLSEHAIPPGMEDLVAIPLSHPLAVVDHGVVRNAEVQSPALDLLLDYVQPRR